MTKPSATLPRLDIGLAGLAPDYDLILCDVWGVVHNGVRHNRAAVAALQAFRKRGGVVILVTNAPAPRAQVIRRLESLDVPPDAYDDVATSGDVTIGLIVAAGCPPIFNIGPSPEVAIYKEAGRLGRRPPRLATIEEAEIAICIGLDETGSRPEDYDGILERLRHRRLELVCANPDIVVEMGDELEYCAGAIAERYTAIGGTVIQAGKPFPAIYERAVSLGAKVRGDIARHRILAIGDAMHTDMAGAHNQGFDAVLVTSGIHRDALHAAGRVDTPDVAALEMLLSNSAARPVAAMAKLVW